MAYAVINLTLFQKSLFFGWSFAFMFMAYNSGHNVHWMKRFCINIIISVFFLLGRVPKSSSMATLAMRAPTDRHPLRIRCTTLTWSRRRPKLSDSTPHSTQSAQWYSLKQTLLLPIEWFSPTFSCILCCGLTGQRRRYKLAIPTCDREQPVL